MAFDLHRFTGGGPIFHAIDSNDLAAIRNMAADKGVWDERRQGLSPLMYAAYCGALPVVELLLELGADPNETIPSTPPNPEKSCFGFARRHRLFSPLHFAVFYIGNPSVIEALIKAGARLDAVSETGWVPLALAKQRRWTEAVEVLRKHGAPEDVR